MRGVDRCGWMTVPLLSIVSTSSVLRLLLDTDDGRGIVIKESDEVGGTQPMICTTIVPRNPAVRRNGRSQRCGGCGLSAR